MTCAWCRSELATTRRDARFCSKRCRQAAFRVRRQSVALERTTTPLRIAYADPPYPGLAKRYYGNEPTYGGEVDHRELVASLRSSFDGWALSTSRKALRDVLPLCPPETIVAPWCKPIGVSSRTAGAHNTWEPLLVVPARRLRPGVRDWLSAQPARDHDDLMGAKPPTFVVWMLRLLGAIPGLDELVDLYPGTGIVGRVWASLSADADASPRGEDDTSRPGAGDTSLEPSADTSSAGVADAFGAAVGDGSNWGIDDPDDWGRMTSLAPRGVGDTSQESDDASLGADGVPTPEPLKVGTP